MNAEIECVIWERGEEGLDRGHEGLGIHIQGGKDFPLFKIVDVADPGIFIAHLTDGGVAQRDGRLKVRTDLSLSLFQPSLQKQVRSDKDASELEILGQFRFLTSL